jgi:hypothetical protein
MNAISKFIGALSLSALASTAGCKSDEPAPAEGTTGTTTQQQNTGAQGSCGASSGTNNTGGQASCGAGH